MDDVQYMMEHGTEQSFLLIIDSSMRSSCSCPTPSDYYVTFPQPFKNVFSVEVVDATIPRTEYSVEKYTNTLSYAPGIYFTYDEALADGSLVEIQVPPGDYNTATLITGLNAALKKASLDKGHAPLEVTPSSNPIELTNRIRLTRSEPFTIFMNPSTIRHVIGFSNPATTLGDNTNWDGSPRYTTDTDLSNDTFISVPTQLSTSAVFVGPVPIETPDYVASLSNSSVTQRFIAESSGLLTSITLRGRSETPGTPVQGTLYDTSFDPPALVQEFSVITTDLTTWTTQIQVASKIFRIVSATYSASLQQVTLQTSIAHGLGAREIFVIQGAETLALNGQWVIAEGSGTTLVIDATIPNPRAVNARASASKEIVEGHEYSLTLNGVDGVDLYRAMTFRSGALELVGFPQDSLCSDIAVSRVGYKVDAPGQCNLTGERYVLIRSPNIEQFMHRDMASSFDRMMPGLGMIKIAGNSGGFREERLNFLGFEARRFHPIGKLHGINIRLETASGRLYNAHGIDHTILICIKMYGPGTSTTIPKTLYPGYEPNTRDMLIGKLERERLSQCLPYT